MELGNVFFTDLLLVWICSVLIHQWSSPSILIMELTPQGSTQGLLPDERCVAFMVDWGYVFILNKLFLPSTGSMRRPFSEQHNATPLHTAHVCEPGVSALSDMYLNPARSGAWIPPSAGSPKSGTSASTYLRSRRLFLLPLRAHACVQLLWAGRR